MERPRTRHDDVKYLGVTPDILIELGKLPNSSFSRYSFQTTDEKTGIHFNVDIQMGKGNGSVVNQRPSLALRFSIKDGQHADSETLEDEVIRPFLTRWQKLLEQIGVTATDSWSEQRPDYSSLNDIFVIAGVALRPSTDSLTPNLKMDDLVQLVKSLPQAGFVNTQNYALVCHVGQREDQAIRRVINAMARSS